MAIAKEKITGKSRFLVYFARSMAEPVLFSFSAYAKYTLFATISFLLLACSSEDANDCIKTAGKTVEKEVKVGSFTKIRTETDVRLLLRDGPEQKVMVKTDKNLMDNVRVKVENGVLSARYNGSCNLVRGYGLTQLIVTAPDITEIRNASAFEVASDGVLSYPKLTLISNTSIRGVEKIRKSGGFFLNLDVEKLNVRCNGISLLKLKGNATLLNVKFNDESPRLEAEDLIVQKVRVFNRGANKIIVNPQQELSGIITGTGDVIAINRPPIVDVEQRFSGRLIFKDQ